MRKTMEKDWQTVLAVSRAVNLAPRGRWDLRRYWRGVSFLEAGEGPEAVVRARAFSRVLRELALSRCPQELFCGSTAGFRTEQLPAEISGEAYAEAEKACRERGERYFITGWDHTLADYPTLLAKGIGGLLQDTAASAAAHDDERETQFLEAVRICLEAFSHFITRWADVCRNDGDEDAAAILDSISLDPPRTLREAMQLVWLTHIALCSQERYHNALGRIDQYLLPFYEADISSGRLTRHEALDLFCHLWARVEELGEVTNICIGGLTPSSEDATNELSYICLEATRLVQSPHTNLSARFHDGTPERFHRACFECIRTGVGFPAVFNDHVLLEGLEEIGIPPETARDYCMVGCIETMLAGRQPAWTDGRFNTPLSLIGALRAMDREPVRSFEKLTELFTQVLARDMEAYTTWFRGQAEAQPPDRFPDPFLSALTRDCIARARDINDGGALFPRFAGVATMGLATVADSLSAVRKLVFEEKALSWEEMMAALDADFTEREDIRLMLLNRAPKYGNADPYVDDLAAWLVDLLSREVLRHRLSNGGRFVSAMAANIQNISAGKEVPATPDGRRAGTPLSDAASPYYGRDRHGPTAFLESVARPDYHLVLTGSVVNMRFDPEHFQGREAENRFLALTQAFVRERIQELQFNFNSDETLRQALEQPELYPGLVVRVSGFSAYFTRLAPEVQQDILRRRAHA